jgi:NADH dehydrogenase
MTTAPTPTPTTTSRKRIVIVGAGFAGAYCAARLQKKLRGRDDVEVLLIDRHNYFIFYPLLVEAGTGELQASHALVALRNFLRATNFVMANVTDVDFQKQEVRYRIDPEHELTAGYDHLVLALGAVTRLPNVPGLKEYAYGMKSLAEALSLRDRAVQLLEDANACNDRAMCGPLLHFVVVGGNFTGVEVAGEFDAYLKEAARRYPNLREDDAKVTLVDRNERILSNMDEDLSRWSADHLRRRGLDLRLNDTVTEIGPDYVVFGDGTRALTHTVIWCAGIAPPPLFAQLGVPVDHGWMVCEPNFRVQGHANVWGIGDCAINPDVHGNRFPATAQHAIQEGKQCADNLVRAIDGQPLLPGAFKNRGTLAAFGRHDAIAKVFRVKLTGFPAWFLWRSVYLMKMPGLGRKFRVALDWTIDLLFRAEYVEMGIDRILRRIARDALEEALRQKCAVPCPPPAATHDRNAPPEAPQLPRPGTRIIEVSEDDAPTPESASEPAAHR